MVKRQTGSRRLKEKRARQTDKSHEEKGTNGQRR